MSALVLSALLGLAGLTGVGVAWVQDGSRRLSEDMARISEEIDRDRERMEP